MNENNKKDPYKRTKEDVREPPIGWRGSLKYLGPGIILSAAIVGAGELIATTTLGARIGFACLWLVIISCLIKLIVQSEFGRYCISSGKTTLETFDLIPGPRYRTSWIVFFWLIMQIITVGLCSGGLVGGLSAILNLLIPSLSLLSWALIISVVSICILIFTKYDTFEKILVTIVILFTFITIICVISLKWTPYSFSFQDIASGLKGKIPAGAMMLGLAVFGATGMGTHELVAYPYWCIEKGYARFVGPVEEEGWAKRAKGWISVMHKDIIISATIFTISTLAFYILGAAILHEKGVIPSGPNLVTGLSYMYSETLGSWAFYLFLIGAFCVLFSSVLSSTGAHARLFLNCLEVLGITKIKTPGKRTKYTNIWVIIVLLLANLSLFVVKVPEVSYILGAALQSIIIPVICISTIYVRYKKLDKRILPSKATDITLWFCTFVITIVTVMLILQQFGIF